MKTLFITPKGLKSLHVYSFNGEDHSFFANYLLAPYLWEPLLKKIPRWVAPNILTTIGCISMILNWIMMVIVSPTGNDEIPSFCYILSTIFIFIYQIADNIDGRQARRTNNATPLGELFDHGNDSLMVGIFALIIVLCLHTSTEMTLCVLLMMYLVFFLSHWEEYHTGSLVLNALLNPTELQLIMMVILMFESVYPDFIKVTIFGFQMNYLIASCFIVISICAFFFYSYNVYQIIKEKKKETFGKGLVRLLPFMIFFISTALLFLCTDESFHKNHFQGVVGISILLNAFITQRIILNRICKEEVDMFYYINIIYAIYVIFMVLGIQQALLTYIMLFIAIIQEVIFWVNVSLCISKEIHINVWTVKHYD